MTQYGYAVRFVRLLKGIPSTSQLAQALGCSGAMLSRYERQKGRRLPQGVTLAMVAEKLGVEVALIEQAARFCKQSDAACKLDHQHRLPPGIADDFLLFKASEEGSKPEQPKALIETLRAGAPVWKKAQSVEPDFALAAELIAWITKRHLDDVYGALDVTETQVRTTHRTHGANIQLYDVIARMLGVKHDELVCVADYCGQEHIQFLRNRAKQAYTTIMEYIPGVVEKVEVLLGLNSQENIQEMKAA